MMSTSKMISSIVAAGLLTAAAGFAEAGSRSIERQVSRSAGEGLKVWIAPVGVSARNIAVKGDNGMATLPIGSTIAICVISARDGLVSIWSRTDDSPTPVRLYPNDYTPADRAQYGARIGAGEELCLGDDDPGYRFEVQGPEGEGELYVHWSEQEKSQFGPEDYPVIPEHRSEQQTFGTRQSVTPTHAGGYSSRTLTYRVAK